MDLQDYLDLIPPPNLIQTNFMAWLRGNTVPFTDVQNVLDAIAPAYNIDLAVGDQLDVLGVILGVSRTVTFEPDGGISPILTDPDYRLVLKAKILQNQWKGTKDEIYDFWQVFFPNYPVMILDNQDMTMSVLVFGMPNDTGGTIGFAYDTDTDSEKGYDEGYWTPFTAFLRELVLSGYFTPKPSGVAVDYAFSEDPVFSYDQEGDLPRGYDEGYWVEFS